jgi:hypothetical protein
MLRGGDLKFQCDVMRPATSVHSRGEEKGKDAILYPNWPCSITPTGGTEGEQAGSTYADMTYQVEGYQDPNKRIQPKDYLLFQGRRLNISVVDDPEMNGLIAVLTCGEQVQ